MTRTENKAILIGLGCYLLFVVWQVVQFVAQICAAPDENVHQYLLLTYIVPLVLFLPLMGIPALLFVRNLRNKIGRVLPVVTMVMSGFMLVYVLYSTFVPDIPKYLIISKLGLLDSYLVVFLGAVKNGGLVFMAGCVALFIGSFLSFPPKKRRLDPVSEQIGQDGCVYLEETEG